MMNTHTLALKSAPHDLLHPSLWVSTALHRLATDRSTDFMSRAFVEFTCTNTNRFNVSLGLNGKVHDDVNSGSVAGGNDGMAPSDELFALMVAGSASTPFSGPVISWDTGRHAADQPLYNVSALLSPSIAPGEALDLTIGMRQSITSADALDHSGSNATGEFVFDATPVPETKTMAMLSRELAVIAALRPRRRMEGESMLGPLRYRGIARSVGWSWRANVRGDDGRAASHCARR